MRRVRGPRGISPSQGAATIIMIIIIILHATSVSLIPCNKCVGVYMVCPTLYVGAFFSLQASNADDACVSARS